MKKKNPEPAWDINTLSIDEKQAVADAVRSCWAEMTQLEEAKENIDACYTDLKEKTGIPKRVFNFLMKASFYADAIDRITENRKLEETWGEFERLTPGKGGSI